MRRAAVGALQTERQAQLGIPQLDLFADEKIRSRKRPNFGGDANGGAQRELPAPLRPGASIHDTYKMGKLIGKGGFGSVFRAQHLQTGRKVAIKVAVDSDHPRELVAEAGMLQELQHPHIVQLLEVIWGGEQGAVYLVEELVTGGSLSDYLKARGRPMRPRDACRLTRHLLDGLSYLHGQGVIHRDIKPANLLLQIELTGEKTLKISDFGLSAREKDESARRTLCGTPEYVAPEVIRCAELHAAGPGYSLPSDLWAAGCVVYTMLTGRPPFRGETLQQLFSVILAGKVQFGERMPSLARHLILNLLVVSPDRRYTAGDARTHPWLMGDEDEPSDGEESAETDEADVEPASWAPEAGGSRGGGGASAGHAAAAATAAAEAEAEIAAVAAVSMRAVDGSSPPSECDARLEAVAPEPLPVRTPDDRAHSPTEPRADALVTPRPGAVAAATAGAMTQSGKRPPRHDRPAAASASKGGGDATPAPAGETPTQPQASIWQRLHKTPRANQPSEVRAFARKPRGSASSTRSRGSSIEGWGGPLTPTPPHLSRQSSSGLLRASAEHADGLTGAEAAHAAADVTPHSRPPSRAGTRPPSRSGSFVRERGEGGYGEVDGDAAERNVWERLAARPAAPRAAQPRPPSRGAPSAADGPSRVRRSSSDSSTSSHPDSKSSGESPEAVRPAGAGAAAMDSPAEFYYTHVIGPAAVAARSSTAAQHGPDDRTAQHPSPRALDGGAGASGTPGRGAAGGGVAAAQRAGTPTDATGRLSRASRASTASGTAASGAATDRALDSAPESPTAALPRSQQPGGGFPAGGGAGGAEDAGTGGARDGAATPWDSRADEGAKPGGGARAYTGRAVAPLRRAGSRASFAPLGAGAAQSSASRSPSVASGPAARKPPLMPYDAAAEAVCAAAAERTPAAERLGARRGEQQPGTAHGGGRHAVHALKGRAAEPSPTARAGAGSAPTTVATALGVHSDERGGSEIGAHRLGMLVSRERLGTPTAAGAYGARRGSSPAAQGSAAAHLVEPSTRRHSLPSPLAPSARLGSPLYTSSPLAFSRLGAGGEGEYRLGARGSRRGSYDSGTNILVL